MKNVLSIVTFAIAALCFAVFIAKVKPLSMVLAPSKPTHCIMASSGTTGCDSESRWSYFTGRRSSRSISGLPSVASSGPTVERKLTT
jgi:hypothetical protein